MFGCVTSIADEVASPDHSVNIALVLHPVLPTPPVKLTVTAVAPLVWFSATQISASRFVFDPTACAHDPELLSVIDDMCGFVWAAPFVPP